MTQIGDTGKVSIASSEQTSKSQRTQERTPTKEEPRVNSNPVVADFSPELPDVESADQLARALENKILERPHVALDAQAARQDAETVHGLLQ